MSSDDEPSGFTRRRNRAVFEEESDSEETSQQDRPSSPPEPQSSSSSSQRRLAQAPAKRQRIAQSSDSDSDSDSESESTPTVDDTALGSPPSAQTGPGLVNGNHRGNGTANRNADGNVNANGNVNRLVNRTANGNTSRHSSSNVNGNGRGSRDMNDFQPGAIVRVSVENFVTYEQADFYPGPNLNMIIGPNGTGKSSLVCAICLGLGYGPKHLGRAATVKEFVKHGKDTATIEIELQKRPKDRANFVIRSQIRREQNTTKWWLNGKEVALKTVLELGQLLSIQVDNLCQFLPQDRVVEFAGSTPVNLLHETLRAAASQEIRDWHEELRDLHKQRKHDAEQLQADKETLQNLQTRQNGLQAEVDRLRERQDIQERVANMRGALLVARSSEAKQAYFDTKARKLEAEASLRRFEEEVQPSLEAVNRKQAYAEAIKPAIRGMERELSIAQASAQECSDRARAAVDQYKALDDEIAAESQGHDEKKKALAKAKSRITSLQADLMNEPAPFDGAAWNQKIRAEEHIVRDIQFDRDRVTTEYDTITREAKAKMAEMRAVESNLEALGTQEGQQISLMKASFPEVARGWDWVRDNQGLFEKEVLGPPMISCSLKDERYSDHIQSLLQIDDFTCFTAQTKNDYKKLSDRLYREMSLSVVIRTCTTPRSTFRCPVSAEEAKSLGLDGFAVDYLEGPDPVLAMLCAERRLHQCGVALSEHGEVEYERLVNHGTISNWAAGRQSYAVRRRREYGPGAMTTVAKGIQPGRFWTSQPVATEEKQELQRRLGDIQAAIEQAGTRRRELKREREGLEGKRNEAQERVNALKADKSAAQTQFTKWRSLPDKIAGEEENQKGYEDSMAVARRRIMDLQYEGDNLVVKRAELVIQYCDAINEIRDAHRALLDAKMRLIEAESDVAGLKKRNSHVMQRLREQRKAVSDAQEEKERRRQEYNNFIQEMRSSMGEQPEKVQLFGNLAQGKTAADIEHEISADTASLELIHAGNPNAMREYEERETKMARVSRQIETRGAKLEQLDAQLRDLMGKWEPRVEALISEISDAFAYNFEQISCAGEIRIHKHDDFDQWELRVMVQFREDETLQQLDSHRQSGGERAVSTVFFLMALQSMAQSPFRVVDEINQGMDPRNERMVHERMVDIACNEHTSQYFLVTPKLLTGLRYDERMRVLCVASGEHMPRNGAGLDFRKCLEVQKGLLSAAS